MATIQGYERARKLRCEHLWIEGRCLRCHELSPFLKGRRQEALVKYVRKHRLACFVCEGSDGPWAKVGVNRRGPWALCAACVGKPRPHR